MKKVWGMMKVLKRRGKLTKAIRFEQKKTPKDPVTIFGGCTEDYSTQRLELMRPLS
jgi:hypothetical protein